MRSPRNRLPQRPDPGGFQGQGCSLALGEQDVRGPGDQGSWVLPPSLLPFHPAQPLWLPGPEQSPQELYHQPGLGEVTEGGSTEHPGKRLMSKNQEPGHVGRNTKSHHLPFKKDLLSACCVLGPVPGKECNPAILEETGRRKKDNQQVNNI